jgi:hypothetical protein
MGKWGNEAMGKYCRIASLPHCPITEAFNGFEPSGVVTWSGPGCGDASACLLSDAPR